TRLVSRRIELRRLDFPHSAQRVHLRAAPQPAHRGARLAGRAFGVRAAAPTGGIDFPRASRRLRATVARRPPGSPSLPARRLLPPADRHPRRDFDRHREKPHLAWPRDAHAAAQPAHDGTQPTDAPGICRRLTADADFRPTVATNPRYKEV